MKNLKGLIVLCIMLFTIFSGVAGATNEILGDFNGDGDQDAFNQALNSGETSSLTPKVGGSISGFHRSWVSTHPDVPDILDWSAGAYGAFSADLNSNPGDELLLLGKKNIVLLHGEIIIPIVISPTLPNVIVSWNASGVASYTSFELDADPDNFVVHFGDFDGDGYQEILLQGKNTGDTTYILESNGTVSQTLNDGDHGMDWSAAAYSLTIADLNNDGVDDIQATSNISGQADEYAYMSGSNVDYVDSVNLNNQPTGTPLGTTAGEFRVNEQGAATYSIPISVPTGTAGVSPQISLNYSSQGGDGVLGIGWSLSAGGAITRCPKTLAQDNEISGISLTNSDPFCLNGQRLVLKSGTHGQGGATYHTEIEGFSKIAAYGNANTAGPLGFTVETKSGEVHYYGYVDAVTGTQAITLKDYWSNAETGADAFNEPSGSATKSVAKAYLLKAVVDVSGNSILFEYNENNGDSNLARVSYGGNGTLSQTPYAYVEANYSTKVNAAIKAGFINGTSFLNDQLLNNITVKLHGQEYRKYLFAYDTPAYAEDNYMLQSVQECVGTDCYPATAFEWERPVPASQSTQEYCEYEPGTPTTCWDVTVTTGFNPFGNKSNKLRNAPNHYSSRVLDLNGDGFSDIVYLENSYWKVALGPSFTSTRTLTNIGNSNSQYLLTLDYNGDGRRDLLVANSASSSWHVVSFENWIDQVQSCEPMPNGGQFCETHDVPKDLKVASIGKTAIGFDGKSQVLDIDGDGLEDIVYQNGNALYWYKNNGGSFANGVVLSNFSSSSSNAFLNGRTEKHTANMKNAAGVDINGDGRSDLIFKVTDTTSTCYVNGNSVPAGSRNECENDIGGTWSSYTTTNWKLYTSTGTSLVEKQSLGNYEDVRVADLNGDGLTDLLQYSSSSNWSYRLSNGQTFLGSKSLPIGATTDTFKDNSYFIDLNKDGAADFLKATTNTHWAVYLSEYKNAEEVQYISRGTLTREADAVAQFGDADGDGKLDLFEGKNGSHGWRISYAPKSSKPDFVIKKITNGFGANTYINYRPMTDSNVYISNSAADDVDHKTFSPMSGMALVSSVQSDTSATTKVEVKYQYGGFLVHRQGRGMLGFELARTIDATTGIKTETTYDQSFPFIGMPLTTRQYTATNVELNNATNVLHTGPTSNGGVFPYIASSSEYAYSIGTDNTRYQINRTDSSFGYDPHGNLTSSTVIVSDHNANNALTTSTNNIYGTSTWEKEKGRLSQTTVTKSRSGSTQSRKTTFGYYPQTHTSVPGLLKWSTVWPDSSTKSLTTEYEYDSFGNKNKVTKTGAENSDGSNTQARIASSSYSSNGRLLDYSIDAAGVRTDYRYNGVKANSLNGRISSTSSMVNGLAFTKQYNSFGQATVESAPGSASVNTHREFCTSVSCGNGGAHYRIRAVQSGAPEKQAYFDFLGREIETRTKNFSGGWTKITRSYDSRGREDKVYEPFIGTIGSFYSQSTYDLFDRVIQIKQPKGELVKTEYYGLRTETIDAKGYRTKSWKNEQGELDRVEDVRGNKLDYTYEAYGNLKMVVATNSSGSVTTRASNIFDAYGNKTQSVDQDKGTWNYAHNAFGELVVQTTAKGDQSYLDYDVAGRLIRRYENEGTSCWNYSNSTGRLLNEKMFDGSNKSLSECGTDSTANFQKNYIYDNDGRINKTDTIISSVNSHVNDTYTTSTSFDSYGRVSSVTYPNNLSITNVYQNGYLDQLKNTQTGRLYQNVDAMNVYGQVTQVTYANGAKETIGYRSEDGKVMNHQLNIGSTVKHYLNYGYDNNHNINLREHHFYDRGFTHWKENLTYDNLNRLDFRDATVYDNSDLTSEFQTDQNYDYDDWGNLTYRYGTGYYKYDGTKKNRLLSIHQTSGFGGTQYYGMSYDGNGNIVNDGAGRTFSYFSFDKVNRISQSNQYSEFLYGTDRSRYFKHDRRTENSQTTDYYTTYIGAYEKIHRIGGGKSAITEHKVSLGNIVITERSNGTDDEHYLHKDHLGSPISITDKSASVAQQFVYDPWGKQTKIYQASDFASLVYSQPTNRGYTGHEHIRDLNIIHMNGRIYDANIGRFMQADPHVQSPGNFQNYNRYSYVLNNPLSMTDPSGFFFKKLFKAIKKYWKQIVSIVLTVYLGPLGAFIGNYLTTGSLRGAIIGGLTSMIGGVDFGGFVANGIVGGVISKAQGGNFGRGFMSAGVGSALGGAVKGVKSAWGKVIASAVVGGTVSRISGGKFANGAYSAAFATALTADWSTKNGFDGNQKAGPSGGEKTSGSIKVGENTFSYTTEGPEGYADSISQQLSSISTTEAGRELLTGLAVSEGEFTFKYRANTFAVETPFFGNDITIHFDPNYSVPFYSTASAGYTAYENSTFALAHELYHAWNNSTASWFGGSDARKIGGRVIGINMQEVYATRFTNLIRTQAGLNYIRTHYNTKRGQVCVDGDGC
ncbi:FG-GAP-like repeat-containing protein [Aliikangiella coralliicola]|uniref:Insecticide toxin TcdB middle/N-terminal domain-containing protein n=1 Tax=Aliikangiella coralliicola TaxID=2592383 RepID=A0A545UEM1_9GAMM|nr:FG-GAP-like repeat-containing protein [Aliikangiella coralliicola]TQV87924.1 hypothetical protein FLL46_11135 [Aliikangiella coralliicola]